MKLCRYRHFEDVPRTYCELETRRYLVRIGPPQRPYYFNVWKDDHGRLHFEPESGSPPVDTPDLHRPRGRIVGGVLADCPAEVVRKANGMLQLALLAERDHFNRGQIVHVKPREFAVEK